MSTAEHSPELVFDSYDPADERRREALFALGNGMLLVRACAPEAVADGIHYPGTYRAGCYDRLASNIGGEEVENESLVNLPNWLLLTFRIQGDTEWFSLDRVTILDYRHKLDFGRGITCRRVRFEDCNGRRTHFREERIVSMAQPHLGAMRIEIVPENWAGKLEIRSALDGAVTNGNVERYRQFDNRHIVVVRSGAVDFDVLLLEAQTLQSRIAIIVAARTQVIGDDVAPRRTRREQNVIADYTACAAAPGKAIFIEKTAAIVTSRDPGISEPRETALTELRLAPPFADLRRAHEKWWWRLRRRGSIEIAEREVDQALALNRFHVLQTSSPHLADLDVGFPPHGWQEGYHGQIFWDDVLVIPFLSVRFPSLARALLLYRYRRLDEARCAARSCGYRGAMFPWRSASTGAEVTARRQINLLSGRWLSDDTRLQRHGGAAIAYNIWQYYLATGDRDFLSDYGAEMLVEIARFWASIAHFNSASGRYEIRGVMGPDEFHDAYPGAAEPGIDNNAYTNVMAAWTLSRAQEVLEHLPAERRDELAEFLQLDAGELRLWDAISRRMRLVFHDGGIISQFEGYERLQELDLDRLAKTHPGERADWALEAQGDSANAYRIAKQADLLMLYYLLPGEELGTMLARLGYDVSRDQLRRTADYYLARTTHDSSLSRVAHAGAFARLDPTVSWRLFRQSLRPDAEPCNSATSEEGLHLSAMAGSMNVVQRHYLGLGFELDAIRLDPAPPRELGAVNLAFAYRQDEFALQWSGSDLRIVASRSNRASAMVRHRSRCEILAPGAELVFRAE